MLKFGVQEDGGDEWNGGEDGGEKNVMKTARPACNAGKGQLRGAREDLFSKEKQAIRRYGKKKVSRWASKVGVGKKKRGHRRAISKEAGGVGRRIGQTGRFSGDLEPKTTRAGGCEGKGVSPHAVFGKGHFPERKEKKD